MHKALITRITAHLRVQGRNPKEIWKKVMQSDEFSTIGNCMCDGHQHNSLLVADTGGSFMLGRGGLSNHSYLMMKHVCANGRGLFQEDHVPTIGRERLNSLRMKMIVSNIKTPNEGRMVSIPPVMFLRLSK